MKNLNYLMDHIQDIQGSRYSRLFSIYLKKHETVTDSPSIGNTHI